MKFKNCEFEGEEYFCYATILPNEEVILEFNSIKIKQEVMQGGEIQVKMNVC